MITINDLKSFLEDDDYKCEIVSDNCIALKFRNGDYGYNYMMLVAIDDSEAKVTIATNIKFREMNLEIWKMVNGFNKQYKFFKFYIHDTGNLLIDADALVRENGDVGEVFELMQLGMEIYKDCYPTIQKQIWS